MLIATLAAPGITRGQSLSFLSGGGPKTLTINSATAGAQPDQVTDDASELSWDVTGIGATAKITVDTSAPGQSFSLFVSLDLTSGTGTEQAERALVDGMSEADLLRDIPTGTPEGTGILTYRAAATVAQGTTADSGSDVHSITYTITAQ